MHDITVDSGGWGHGVRRRMRRTRLKAPQDWPVGYYHRVSRIIDRLLRLKEAEKEHVVKLMWEYDE